MATERAPLNTWTWGSNLRPISRTPFLPRDFRRPYGVPTIARAEFFGAGGAGQTFQYTGAIALAAGLSGDWRTVADPPVAGIQATAALAGDQAVTVRPPVTLPGVGTLPGQWRTVAVPPAAVLPLQLALAGDWAFGTAEPGLLVGTITLEAETSFVAAVRSPSHSSPHWIPLRTIRRGPVQRHRYRAALAVALVHLAADESFEPAPISVVPVPAAPVPEPVVPASAAAVAEVLLLDALAADDEEALAVACALAD